MLGGLYFGETERVVAAKFSASVQIGLMLYNTLQRDAPTPSVYAIFTLYPPNQLHYTKLNRNTQTRTNSNLVHYSMSCTLVQYVPNKHPIQSQLIFCEGLLTAAPAVISNHCNRNKSPQTISNQQILHSCILCPEAATR